MATLYQRSPQALSAPVDDDHVALQTSRGMAFGLEGVTACVWEMLQQPTSFDEIVAALRAQYDVDDAQCREEIGALLRDMAVEGLVVEETQ